MVKASPQAGRAMVNCEILIIRETGMLVLQLLTASLESNDTCYHEQMEEILQVMSKAEKSYCLVV